MLYTVEDILNARDAIKRDGLDASDSFLHAPIEDLRIICNGIGPESWSASARATADKVFWRYVIHAMIHDFDYHLQIPKKDADKRFLKNMFRTWKKEFGFWRWFRPKARKERIVILSLYAAVALGGDSAYKEAAKPIRRT